MTGGRQYIDYNPRKGYPAGPDLFYECGICGDVIPSMPENGAACRCGNVFIDADAGRVSVKQGEKLRIFRSSTPPDRPSPSPSAPSGKLR